MAEPIKSEEGNSTFDSILVECASLARKTKDQVFVDCCFQYKPVLTIRLDSQNKNKQHCKHRLPTHTQHARNYDTEPHIKNLQIGKTVCQ